MFLITSGVNISTFLGWLAHEILTSLKFQGNQTYDYTDLVAGRDYVFEVLDDDCDRGCMSARWRSIKCGDYIILSNSNLPNSNLSNSNSSGTDKYQVEEIDYYSEPSDMWMALLRRVNE